LLRRLLIPPALHQDIEDMAVLIDGSPQWRPWTAYARPELRLEAGARHERTLFAVACKPLILIEAPSSAYRRGMLALGTHPQAEEETSGASTPSSPSLMVASTGTPAPWSLCLVNPDGAIVRHRPMTAAPEPLLKAIAPDQEALVVCGECLVTWSWLADLCAREGIPVGLGHALDMKALHGGTAKHDRIDAQQIAGLLRGGMLPQADLSPAEGRAPRELLRRRLHFMRQRAAWLTHVQRTNRPHNRPELGEKMASKANRGGVAERFPTPAVPQSIAGDLALLGHDDHRRRAVDLAVLTTAKPHDAHTLSRRRPVPGTGELLRLVLR
jgi:hypothetical protein